MTGQREVDVIRRDVRTAPQLSGLFMRNQPTIQRPPCRDKPRLGIEITQPDSSLDRSVGKRRQPVSIDRGVRRVHQHDMQRLQQCRVELTRIGAGEQRRHKRRKRSIINAHGLQDIGGKLRAGGIAHGSAADDLRLVPERLERAAHLIHHGTAGFVIAARHQLCFDQPLFPFQPGFLIGKLADQILQRLGPAGGGKPGKSGRDQRIGVCAGTNRRHRTMRDDTLCQRRQRRRCADRRLAVQKQNGPINRSAAPDGCCQAGGIITGRLKPDIGNPETGNDRPSCQAHRSGCRTLIHGHGFGSRSGGAQVCRLGCRLGRRLGGRLRR